MKVVITIEIGTTACETWEEVKDVVDRYLKYFYGNIDTSEVMYRKLVDINGNTVGSMEVSE